MPQPAAILKQRFPYTPTAGQQAFFELFERFIGSREWPLMVLQGYAGTGKTSLVAALVRTLPLFNYKYMLLAPTGRAAKVMAGYSGRTAFTVHKIIYKVVAEEGGPRQFVPAKNYHKKTVFIVDEASMLSVKAGFGERGLLEDLLDFVFTHPDNKLLLVGDTAQLPPVGQGASVALEPNYLQQLSGRQVLLARLTEVMRQHAGSGILQNATALRQVLASDRSGSRPAIRLTTQGHRDVYRMTTDRLGDGLRYAYDKVGPDNTVVICRSNRDAVQYNRFIRQELFFRQEEIEPDDRLMIVRNNYYYVPDEAPSGFLANGDFVEVRKIISFEERYGLRFATLQLQLTDGGNSRPFEANVLLDTLHSHAPALEEPAARALYEAVRAEYADISSKKARQEAIRQDPWLNALQVKFAYAITCHKAQGGQWPLVFIDQGYLPPERLDDNFVRWLYTAITRATGEVYLVNFLPQFFTG